jgi:hypothetical protein
MLSFPLLQNPTNVRLEWLNDPFASVLNNRKFVVFEVDLAPSQVYEDPCAECGANDHFANVTIFLGTRLVCRSLFIQLYFVATGGVRALVNRHVVLLLISPRIDREQPELTHVVLAGYDYV